MHNTYVLVEVNIMDTRLANLLGALALAVGDASTQAMCDESGLSTSAVSALIVIGNNPRLNVEGVSKTIRLAHSSTVRLLEKLQELSLVEPHTGEDRRCVEYSLTRKGRKTVEKMLKRREHALATFVKAGVGPETKRSLADHLDSLLTTASTDAVACSRICRLCDETACDLDRCPVERVSRRLTLHSNG